MKMQQKTFVQDRQLAHNRVKLLYHPARTAAVMPCITACAWWICENSVHWDMYSRCPMIMHHAQVGP